MLFSGSFFFFVTCVLFRRFGGHHIFEKCGGADGLGNGSAVMKHTKARPDCNKISKVYQLSGLCHPHMQLDFLLLFKIVHGILDIRSVFWKFAGRVCQNKGKASVKT